MNKKKIFDMLERAGWTFVQSFLAAWTVAGFQFNKIVLVGCVAAGFSALKTFVKETL